MNDNKGPIGPADYAEPRCVLCGEPYGSAPQVKPVPQQRIVEKVNDYMSRRDYAGVERHLKYWLEEAKLGNDLQGQLTIRNEMVGHYRKVGDREHALENVEEALKLVDALGFEGTLSAATTYTNAGTACNAFGEDTRAMELFEKARKIYESNERTDPALLGGLYNNMALTCVALKRFGDAQALYDRAMKTMERVPGGALEQAITCLNRADALEAEFGPEQAEGRIFDLLDQAYDLLNAENVIRDGYYAFVCEKCAPSFSYYGYFMEAEELERRAKELYEGA